MWRYGSTSAHRRAVSTERGNGDRTARKFTLPYEPAPPPPQADKPHIARSFSRTGSEPMTPHRHNFLSGFKIRRPSASEMPTLDTAPPPIIYPDDPPHLTQYLYTADDDGERRNLALTDASDSAPNTPKLRKARPTSTFSAHATKAIAQWNMHSQQVEPFVPPEISSTNQTIGRERRPSQTHVTPRKQQDDPTLPPGHLTTDPAEYTSAPRDRRSRRNTVSFVPDGPAVPAAEVTANHQKTPSIPSALRQPGNHVKQRSSNGPIFRGLSDTEVAIPPFIPYAIDKEGNSQPESVQQSQATRSAAQPFQRVAGPNQPTSEDQKHFNAPKLPSFVRMSSTQKHSPPEGVSVPSNGYQPFTLNKLLKPDSPSVDPSPYSTEGKFPLIVDTRRELRRIYYLAEAGVQLKKFDQFSAPATTPGVSSLIVLSSAFPNNHQLTVAADRNVGHVTIGDILETLRQYLQRPLTSVEWSSFSPQQKALIETQYQMNRGEANGPSLPIGPPLVVDTLVDSKFCLKGFVEEDEYCKRQLGPPLRPAMGDKNGNYLIAFFGKSTVMWGGSPGGTTTATTGLPPQTNTPANPLSNFKFPANPPAQPQSVPQPQPTTPHVRRKSFSNYGAAHPSVAAPTAAPAQVQAQAFTPHTHAYSHRPTYSEGMNQQFLHPQSAYNISHEARGRPQVPANIMPRPPQAPPTTPYTKVPQYLPGQALPHQMHTYQTPYKPADYMGWRTTTLA